MYTPNTGATSPDSAMKYNIFLDLIGFHQNPVQPRETFLSLLGGFLGILVILLGSYRLLGPEAAAYILPSMGASAVLLFAAPHAPFSQPWNLVGGHLLSAFIGVACWQWIPDYTLAASASVGLAIGVMYFARCIHPPGGATALAFVIGPESLHHLGYAYVLTPVLVNTLLILLVALVFNGLFHWRRYPTLLHTGGPAKAEIGEGYPPINHEDFVYALSHIDTLVDIDEQDLLTIYALATRRHARRLKSGV